MAESPPICIFLHSLFICLTLSFSRSAACVCVNWPFKTCRMIRRRFCSLSVRRLLGGDISTKHCADLIFSYTGSRRNIMERNISQPIGAEGKDKAGQISRFDRRHTRDRRADQRNSFQRDRDRILYSPMFRRLAGVTQVVHAAEGHIFHNRLTHSLKVAQIGRRVAEYLLSTEPKELIEAVGGIDPD